MIDFEKVPPKEEKVKEPIYRGSFHVPSKNKVGMYNSIPLTISGRPGKYYCILRINKSYKKLGEIVGFEKHTERMQDTPNADPKMQNEILIGGYNLADKVKEYISDCHYIKPDSTIARDMMVTASPEFFKDISQEDLNKWVGVNLNFLEKRYGSNIIYATLHLDEKTPHIHALLVPKVYSEARKCYILSSNKIFGNKVKLRQLQDDYAKSMGQVFPCLQRGIKNSRAQHLDVKKFYGIIDNARTAQDEQELHKHNIVLKHQLKGSKATLDTYRNMSSQYDMDKHQLTKLVDDLRKEVKELKVENKLYKDTVKQLSLTHRISEKDVARVMNYVKNELELKK